VHEETSIGPGWANPFQKSILGTLLIKQLEAKSRGLARLKRYLRQPNQKKLDKRY